MYLRLLALLLLAGALAAAATAPGPTAASVNVSAGAHGVSVTVPGQAPTVAGASAAPGTASVGTADSFAHPGDGVLVRTGAVSTSSAARNSGAVGAHAVGDVLDVVLFNGEITAASVAVRANATAAGADTAGSSVSGLTVFGAAVDAAPGQRHQLGDWGTLLVLGQESAAPVADGQRSARSAVTGLHVVLTAEHGGFPAGTEIVVGRAEAAASTPAAAPSPTRTAPARTTPGPPAKPQPRQAAKPLPKPPEPSTVPPGKVRVPPIDISAPLSPGRFVFPVYGASSFTDTFRAPRAGVGWHHGEDIFAPLGAPILAVTDGTLFSVGWNKIGGYRLWLRDRQGNQFYYAHLSAYSPLAVDGREVKAGDVIGFNGNTGDAQTTPYHVHFEIHPVGLLPLGYDGVVNPFPFLSAWRRLEDVSFAVGRGWAPPVPLSATAPKPGAVLLGHSDISSASGLEPGSLERALAAPLEQTGRG